MPSPPPVLGEVRGRGRLEEEEGVGVDLAPRTGLYLASNSLIVSRTRDFGLKKNLLVDKALQLFRILSLDLEKPLTRHTCSPIYFHNILPCFCTLYHNFANCTTTFTLVP